MITISSPAPPPQDGHLTARYAELRDPAARQVLRARSRVSGALRRHLHDDGFTEVDTPLLQHARPARGRSFRTQTRSLDPHTYLRSSPLHLRAMLTTGLPRVFEIGRCFRDERADPTHSPEYSLVEVYQAGADYRAMRRLARDLIAAAAAAGGGTLADLAGEWPAVPFYEAVSAAVGEQVTPGTSAARLRELAAALHVTVRRRAGADEIVLELYDRLVEPATAGPVFYVDFPAGPSPLAKPCPQDPRVAQKWDLVIGRREIATAYTEQENPDELRRALAPDGDRILSAEAAQLNDEWLAVFASGMPAAAGGLCIGLERLLLAVTGSASLRDVIPFPFPPAP